MNSSANSNRVIGPKLTLAVTTAIAGALLSGCTTSSAAPASVSASRAEAALAAGKHEQAINHAEAAVLAEPRNARTARCSAPPTWTPAASLRRRPRSTTR